jgi:hypothetical protein
MRKRFNFVHEWILGDCIDGGGFGQVYAAKSAGGETAVVKLVPKAPGAAREFLFVDVVPIIDSGESADSWVPVMPRAERSLRVHLDQTGKPLDT